MSQSHDDTDPIEHDPTGMRALLGSLPDPGPMPADLVARIEAALAAEAAAAPHARPALVAAGAPERVDTDAQRPAGGEADQDEHDLDDLVVPLRPRRRSHWHLVAVAAGVLGVLGIGGLVVETLSPGGLQASIGMSAEDSSSSAADGSDSGAAPQEADGGARTLLAEDGSLGVVVLGSGRQYTAAGLAEEVRASLPWDGTGRRSATAPSASSSTSAEREVGFGPLASAAGARACAEGLGVPESDTVVVDLADVDGEAAAVLVATSADGARRVWAVQRTCTADAPDLLTGPATVP